MPRPESDIKVVYDSLVTLRKIRRGYATRRIDPKVAIHDAQQLATTVSGLLIDDPSGSSGDQIDIYEQTIQPIFSRYSNLSELSRAHRDPWFQATQPIHAEIDYWVDIAKSGNHQPKIFSFF